MKEQITLDPSEVSGDRVEVALHGGAFNLAEAGPLWGDALVEAAMAAGEYGSVPIDFTVPNRIVELPLSIRATRTMSFADARRLLQQKAALLQQDGGWLKREMRDGSKLYLDVIGATLRLGGGSEQALRDFDADAVLLLETLPDWYGDEVELGAASGDGAVRVSLTNVPGDHPARLRVVLRDGSGAAQRSLLFAARHEQAATTAAMDFRAVDLTPLGGATSRATYVEYATLPPTWVAALSTRLASGGHMTHVGTHRVWVLAAASGSGSGAASTRLEYTAGSGAAPELKPIRALTPFPTWLDLGEVQLPRAAAGAQRWEGRILVSAPTGWAFNAYRVRVLPVEDAYGKINATTVLATGDSVAAWDTFAHAAGALSGKTAPEGGRWTVVGTILTSGEVAYRTAVGTAIAVLADIEAAQTDLRASIDAAAPGAGTTVWAGLVGREGTGRHVRGGVSNHGDGLHSFWLYVMIDGVATTIADSGYRPGNLLGWHDYRLVIDTAGNARLDVDGAAVVQAFHASLATGGALASGSIGLYDSTTASSSPRRSYDNFFMGETAQALDAVLHPNRAAEITTTGYRRAGSDGLAYAPLVIHGDLPRLPVSGAERRPVEFYVTTSRAIHGQAAGLEEDRLDATVLARPCYLFTPDA